MAKNKVAISVTISLKNIAAVQAIAEAEGLSLSAVMDVAAAHFIQTYRDEEMKTAKAEAMAAAAAAAEKTEGGDGNVVA